MTEVDSLAELDGHNEFYYDSATGSVTFALCSFSEVVAVKSLVSKWAGGVAGKLAGGSGTESDPYLIANADQLAYFAQLVGSGNSYRGTYFTLLCDIDLGWTGVEEWVNAKGEVQKYVPFNPIGYYFTDDYDGDGIKDAQEATSDVYSTLRAFKGHFDGNGKTIKNFYQNTWATKGDYNSGYPAKSNYYKDGFGLFGYLEGATVKNLTVENFSSDGEFTPTGTIAAYACNSTVENITIVNCNPRVYNTGNGGIIGIAGNSDDPENYTVTLKDITVDQTNKITALWGSWDVACGGLIGMFRGAGKVYMENCHVAAQIDVYNDVCGNYQYYWYRYAGMMIGTNKNMITDANGYTVPETKNFTTKNCSVYIGDWNNYYYCELVANSLASYTHDHQFSRLTIIDNISEIADVTDNGQVTAWKTTGSFLIITKNDGSEFIGECYHIFKDSEGKLYRHLHDVADATNPEVTEVVNGKTVLKEDNQIVFLPFNQICTGYGWGVKHIPVMEYDKNADSGEEGNGFAGVIINSRGSQDSVQKFKPLSETSGNYVRHYPSGTTTIYLSDLFAPFTAEEAADVKFGQIVVSVAPSPDSLGYVKVVKSDIKTSTDWLKSSFTIQGTGTFYVTISDYYFCKPTTVVVVIDPATNVEDTFASLIPDGNSITYTEPTYVGGARVYATASGITVSKDDQTKETVMKVNYSQSNGAASTATRYIDVNCPTKAGQQFTVEIDFKIEKDFVIDHFLSLLTLRGNYTIEPASSQVFHRNAGLIMDKETGTYWLACSESSEAKDANGNAILDAKKILQVPVDTWIHLEIDYCFRGNSNNLYYVITGSYEEQATGETVTASSPRVKLQNVHGTKGYYVEQVRIGSITQYGAQGDAYALKGYMEYKNFKLSVTAQDVNFDTGLNNVPAFDQKVLGDGSVVDVYVKRGDSSTSYLGDGVALYTPSKVPHLDRIVTDGNGYAAINYHSYEEQRTFSSYLQIESSAECGDTIQLSARFQLPSQVYLTTIGGRLATEKKLDDGTIVGTTWSAQGDFGNYEVNNTVPQGNPYISLFRLVGSKASHDLVAMKLIEGTVTIFDPQTGTAFATFTTEAYADQWFTVDVSYNTATGEKTVTVKNASGSVLGSNTCQEEKAFGEDIIGVNIGCTEDDVAIKGDDSLGDDVSYQPQVNNEAEIVHVSSFRRTLYVDDYSFVVESVVGPGSFVNN